MQMKPSKLLAKKTWHQTEMNHRLLHCIHKVKHGQKILKSQSTHKMQVFHIRHISHIISMCHTCTTVLPYQCQAMLISQSAYFVFLTLIHYLCNLSRPLTLHLEGWSDENTRLPNHPRVKPYTGDHTKKLPKAVKYLVHEPKAVSLAAERHIYLTYLGWLTTMHA